jgi:hypothetical protein
MMQWTPSTDQRCGRPSEDTWVALTDQLAMIPPVRTDPVWGRAQSGPVPPEGRTGLGPRLAVLDWTGLVWTDPFTHIILSLLFSQVLPKT